jgi:hypothetical protein
MKHLILTLSMLVFCCYFSFGQKLYNKCSQTEHTKNLIKQRPGYAQQLHDAEYQIQRWILNNLAQRGSNRSTQDTICVVVHVVYNTSQQNISDAQVRSQIDVMNQDFSRENPDTVNTPLAFQPVAGSLPYHFQLARQDPSGNPTNGIDRRHTTVTSFIDDDKVKAYSTGGLGAWDVTKYLNLWVCPLGGGLLGYGEFPTGTPSITFGLAVDYRAFGTIGTVLSPSNKGRTTTHEVSHCFNLYHIWGDDGGACTGSDLINDTPNQADATYGCPAFPHNDACNTTANGIMFMNYMDYSDDRCMNMFTQQQVVRMNAAINNFYPGIVNSIGLTPGIATLDVGVLEIENPTGNTCNSQVTPTITLKCFGAIPATSIGLRYQIDGGPSDTFNFSGSLSQSQTSIFSLNAIPVGAGPHIIKIWTTSPNGSSDANTANDTLTSLFNVFLTGLSLPISEGFEGTFPPVNWALHNPDESDTWATYANARHHGSKSIRVDNFYYDAAGGYDELILPNVDLRTMTNPKLSFDYSYAYYNATATQNDSMEILLSIDCGITWESLFYAGGSDLATAPATTQSFRPANTSQWNVDTIDLSFWSAESNVIMKFRNIGYYQNNLYLDDINVSGDSLITLNTGFPNLSENSFRIYPNPTSDRIFIDWSSLSEIKKLDVINLLGETVFTTDEFSSRIFSINLSSFSKGLYTVKAMTDGGTFSKRVILQ